MILVPFTYLLQAVRNMFPHFKEKVRKFLGLRCKTSILQEPPVQLKSHNVMLAIGKRRQSNPKKEDGEEGRILWFVSRRSSKNYSVVGMTPKCIKVQRWSF